MARSSALGSGSATQSEFSASRSFARRTLAALTGAALSVGFASSAQAYDVKKTSAGDFVHWEQRNVGYTIDSSVERAVSRGNNATIDAMGSWSGSVGAPELEVLPADEASPKAPDFDRKNGIFFMKRGYAPAGRALAITVLTYDNESGNILDADVIFNGKYQFEVLQPVVPTTAEAHIANTDGISHDADAVEAQDAIYDLQHVIAHELGHSLGMNDELGRHDALMYRYSAPNDASLRSPAADDIAGLAELYSKGYEAHGNGCGSATVAPKKPSNSASHAAMFVTLGFLLFLTLRAKSDRRTRLAFATAITASAIALVPNLSGTGVARASVRSLPMVGHARAKIVATSTSIENGLFKTSYKLATTACHASVCPNAGHGETWGGTIGKYSQMVGSYYAPAMGAEVDVSFADLPKPMAALQNPLAGRVDAGTLDSVVRVITLAP